MSIVKNFLYNTVYQILIILLPIITVPYISRVLGDNGVGLYSYTAAYSQYFILLGTIGLTIYGRRQIAYVKDNREMLSKEFSSIYTLQFITTTLALIIYILIFVILNPNNKLLYLIQSITIVAAIFDISWVFIGIEDMKSIVTKNSIIKILGVILIFILVKEEGDISIYALITGVTILSGQLIMWINVLKIVDFQKVTRKEIYKHIKPSLSLFISQLAIQVYILLDRTMLGIMTDVSQVGLYDNSQKTIKLILTLVTSLGTVMLPRMSSLYLKGDMDKFKSMVYKAFKFVNFMSFPMVLGLISIAKPFSYWFYGEKFMGIDILLRLGSLIILAISWSNILGMQIMIPMKEERKFTISVTIGALINLILNIIFIYNLKSVGTTISSILAEFSVTITQLYLLRELVDIKKIIKTTFKPIIGSITMFIVVSLLVELMPVGVLYTGLQVVSGGLVYLSIMYLLKDELLINVIIMINSKIKGELRIYEKI